MSRQASCEFSGRDAMVSRGSAKLSTDRKRSCYSGSRRPTVGSPEAGYRQVADAAQPVIKQARDNLPGLAAERSVSGSRTGSQSADVE
ncbi:hypothetical protein P0D72_28635 [Paraburkholderia sediminicola]|uniref:hypothetical protein n=1 Tax=Paraburkholderia sediminicola TaxID=458836 RepID=UPI0038B85351